MTRLLLAWRRKNELVRDQHPLEGYIALQKGEQSTKLWEFDGKDYQWMILQLSKTASNHPDAGLFMLRLEQPNALAIELSEKDANLLRTDPLRYIAATNFSQRTVRLGDAVSVKDRTKVSLRPLRAGSDVLAEAFGEELYLRMRRGGSTECPFCGRWLARTGTDGVDDSLFRCRNCNIAIAGVRAVPTKSGGWVALRTEQLLMFGEGREGCERYYLPREWNTNGPWISHADLKQKYEQYSKEKRECLDKHRDLDRSG